MKLYSVLSLLVLGTVIACSGQQGANATASASGGQSSPKPEAASQAPAPMATHESAGQQPVAQAAVQSVTGTVVETMNAANYTYVRVKSGTGELWAASAQFPVKVGDTVVVPLESPMENFRSQSLKRDFPLIYFTSQILHEGEQPAQASMPPGHPPTAGAAAGGAPPPAVTEPMAPPPGGSTVAKVWADRKTLAGKPVTVRGKVVKFNAMIMNTNWMHIQDGTGTAADGSNDMTITTAGTAKVGDIVTATGTIALDKDFGAGYKYAVIIENAKIATK